MPGAVKLRLCDESQHSNQVCDAQVWRPASMTQGRPHNEHLGFLACAPLRQLSATPPDDTVNSRVQCDLVGRSNPGIGCGGHANESFFDNAAGFLERPSIHETSAPRMPRTSHATFVSFGQLHLLSIRLILMSCSSLI